MMGTRMPSKILAGLILVLLWTTSAVAQLQPPELSNVTIGVASENRTFEKDFTGVDGPGFFILGRAFPIASFNFTPGVGFSGNLMECNAEDADADRDGVVDAVADCTTLKVLDGTSTPDPEMQSGKRYYVVQVINEGSGTSRLTIKGTFEQVSKKGAGGGGASLPSGPPGAALIGSGGTTYSAAVTRFALARAPTVADNCPLLHTTWDDTTTPQVPDYWCTNPATNEWTAVIAGGSSDPIHIGLARDPVSGGGGDGCTVLGTTWDNTTTPQGLDFVCTDVATNQWTAAAATASGAGTTTFDIAQAGHGRAVGDPVIMTANDTVGCAQANTIAGSQVAGVVLTVTDANNLTIMSHGYVPGFNPAGVPIGGDAFLSAATPCGYTSTEPSGAGEFRVPLGITVGTGGSARFRVDPHIGFGQATTAALPSAFQAAAAPATGNATCTAYSAGYQCSDALSILTGGTGAECVSTDYTTAQFWCTP